MLELLRRASIVSKTDTTVLLTGETGTGKGVVANYIHQNSLRKEHPFITLHCGAIPDTLLESELFGHEKGAFTGALKRKLGKFEIADGGTLFLDEIGTITPALQIKLLQVLQDKTFQRVGGEKTIQSNVRIIAATNSDLKQMVNEGTFRRDLYYRLDVFSLHLPPLRERIEDISLFVNYFLAKLNKIYNKNINDVEPEILLVMQNYLWPGNIRELENLIERAYVMEDSRRLSRKNFPLDTMGDYIGQEVAPNILPTLTLKEIRQIEMLRLEEKYLRDILSRNSGRIKEAAAMAGVGVRQLNKLLNKYRINKNEFKVGKIGTLGSTFGKNGTIDS